MPAQGRRAAVHDGLPEFERFRAPDMPGTLARANGIEQRGQSRALTHGQSDERQQIERGWSGGQL